MSDFKTRLLEEKQQLDEKIEKLDAFFETETFQNIDAKQQSLLNVQSFIMKAYSQVLLERITWLNQTTD